MSRHRFGTRAPRTTAERTHDGLPVRKRFLIVCEGEQTEPNYFKTFRMPGVVVQVEGTGRNTLSLVDEAIRLKKEAEEDIATRRRKQFDQCWCVFDQDSFKASAFNSAIAKAEAHGFQVAYSNECFELWYLLHFDYHDAQLHRQSFRDRLTEYLGKTYEKNSREMYAHILPRQPDAFRNAKRLLTAHAGKAPDPCNPCTTVHRLVMELNKSVVVVPTP